MALSVAPPTPREWLNQAEVADLLGVTDRTVRNFIARGVLPASRIRNGKSRPGPVRIRRRDVDALLEPIPATAVPA
ncbi:helix-turn-helix domain-containing protein [Phycicoccus avicenniae]|uniref:helix-turn-helix domain-containing protein n=1 Tax=Phycicoccus avicenniae TaxID=2828860 RepID=UPI003D2CD8E6